MIGNHKKIEYWLYFCKVVENNKKGYGHLTPRRLKIAREKYWHDQNFWWDIITRHGGENCSPEEMKKVHPGRHNHMIDIFASYMYGYLIKIGEIKQWEDMEDRYPEPEVIKKITDWGFDSKESYRKFFEYVKGLWKYPEYFQIKRKYIYISTGGWSGHEEIISAMKGNRYLFWSICWYSSRRGGHYVFRWPRIDWGEK